MIAFTSTLALLAAIGSLVYGADTFISAGGHRAGYSILGGCILLAIAWSGSMNCVTKWRNAIAFKP